MNDFKVGFRNTNSEKFLSWLEKFTNRTITLYELSIKKGERTIQFQPAKRRKPAELHIDGIYYKNGEDLENIEDYLVFKIINSPINNFDLQIFFKDIVISFLELFVQEISLVWTGAEEFSSKFSSTKITAEMNNLMLDLNPKLIELCEESELGKAQKIKEEDKIVRPELNTVEEDDKGKHDLPPVEDPTDQRILDLVTKNPDLTDRQVASEVGGLSRQTVNTRRRALEKMGYRVR